MFQLAHPSHAWASTVLLLDPIPELASGSQRGPGQWVRCGRLPTPPPPHISVHTDMFIHTQQREAERALPVCFTGFTVTIKSVPILHWNTKKDDIVGIGNKEGFIYFLNQFFNCWYFLTVADCLIHQFLAAFLLWVFICTYFSVALHNHLTVICVILGLFWWRPGL